MAPRIFPKGQRRDGRRIRRDDQQGEHSATKA